MEDSEDHRIDLEIIFCNFKDKKQNFQNSIQADILDNISKKNYQPGNFGLFEFSSRGSDEMMEDQCTDVSSGSISFLRYRNEIDRNHEISRNLLVPFSAKMNSANSFLPWIYIVFHGTYVRDATTIWLAGTRLHGNSPEIAVQFQSSPRNSLEIHSFSSARGATRLRTRTWKRSNSFLGRISYVDELSSPQWQIRVHATPSGSANDCASLCAKLTNFPFPPWLSNFNAESTKCYEWIFN